MAIFHKGSTVICSIEIWKSGVKYSPSPPDTSVTITIWDSHNGLDIDNAYMTEDATGEYSYDYDTSDCTVMGDYKTRYRAVDGSRITITQDSFRLDY